MWDYFKTRFRLLKNIKTNKYDKPNIKHLNGYDAMSETLGGGDTFTCKQPAAVN